MNTATLLVPDLFLPPDLAAAACAGLELPALGKWLARAQAGPLAATTLEEWLCTAFGAAEGAVAPVTLRADGIDPGPAYWLRADPVHLHILRDRLILEPVSLAGDEAQRLCASLNAHFAGEGVHFAAPHPQRWYLRTETMPDIGTHWLSRVEGGDVRDCLPYGADAVHWHRLMNEAQMLLYAHPVNAAREARGALPANSVWLWGGGVSGRLQRPCAAVCGDSELARAFALAADIPALSAEQGLARCGNGDGDVVFIAEGPHRAARRGDVAAWRAAVDELERTHARPLLALLRAGRVGKLTLDAPQSPGARRFTLTRGDLWKFWRRARGLESGAAGS